MKLLVKFFTWGYAKYVFVPGLRKAMDNPDDRISVFSFNDDDMGDMEMEVEFEPDFEIKPRVH
jgi:hypothetical protein